MDSRTTGWWRRHGWTVAILLTAFGMALIIRVFFAAQVLHAFGPLYIYGGGSDSFYHSRVMAYIALNHQNLVHDSLLRYPIGAVNPREPLFDWMNALLGMLFAGSFGGSPVTAGSFFLDIQGPLWSGLSIFPLYLIGKEIRGRRVGLVAALIYPFLVANIDSSTLGYANYLSFYTFFILLFLYSYIRTVKAVGSRRWVESYRHPRQVVAGIRAFVRTERTAVKWAFFAGVSFGALALSWQGYSFAVAIVVIFVVFALLVERIRKVDSFGLYVATWIIGIVGFLIAMPYYGVQGNFGSWFNIPLLVYFGALVIFLPFVALRDTPWVISIPVLVATALLAVGGLALINNLYFVSIVTGQGYFVKTLVYSTVAEAQAPSIDSLILGYGVVTFFLAFVGLALVLYTMVRQRFPRALMLFFAFAIVSIYLPLSAAKFFYVASPIFALLPAEAIVRALDVGGYPTLRRNVASLLDRRGKFAAFRRAFKVRHVLVMLLVLLILIPNVWYAIDAGIPINLKAQYNRQIYDTLPPFLRTSASNATSFYLGAAGTLLDTPTQYDEAGYNWLAQQDQNLPPPGRPAFISWWDYGFQAVAEGQHPTVADNFQNGIEPAGNFLLAQNQSLAIGILATTLLSAEARLSGQPYLPSALNAILAADGVNLVQLHTFMVNQSQDIPIVIAHPERYLPVDPTHLSGLNAMFDTVSYLLATTLSESGIVRVYDDIEKFTGWSIQYGMVDSRLFPFSGSNTGIFYAPADLTARVIGSDGSPTAYYRLSALGSDGNTYPVNKVPPGVQILRVDINYQPAFYNSMIYRIFAGYNGTDIGQGTGIPGISGTVATGSAEPGWMLSHFRVVYRTAYYCPHSAVCNPGSGVPANLPDVALLAKRSNGTANTSTDAYYSGGETFLQYYPGQTLLGSITLPSGAPVSGARLTVYDSWGIPHMSVVSQPSGQYSVILPPGNDTVNVTIGPVQGLTQAGATVLSTLHVNVPQSVGLSPDAPNLVRPIVLAPAKVQGFVYWNAANNSTYQPSTDPLVVGAAVTLNGSGLPTLRQTTDSSGAFSFAGVSPGLYNFTVNVNGSRYLVQPTQKQIYVTNATQIQPIGLTPGRITGLVRTAQGQGIVGALVVAQGPNGSSTQKLTQTGGAFLLDNLVPGNYSVSAQDPSIGLGAAPVGVSVPASGKVVHLNLTLSPAEAFSLTVVANGNPAPGIPVRFTPILPTAFSSPAPVPGEASYTLMSGPSGTIAGDLPAGNYSVYALGLVGGQWYSGFATDVLSSIVGSGFLPPLFLSPAFAVRGTVTGPSNVSLRLTQTSVTAFDAYGNQIPAFVNGSGGFVLHLPAGPYTLIATLGPNNTTSVAGAYAALSTATAPSPGPVSISLTPAIAFRPTVGTMTTHHGFYPSVPAVVQVSAPSVPATITTITNITGGVRLFLPSTLPSQGGYCVQVSFAGYAPWSRCGYAPADLANLKQILLTLLKVQVNVVVRGLPSNTSLTLNLTAASPTANNVTGTGNSVFQFSVYPGLYVISGFAPARGATGLYMFPGTLGVNIPRGVPQNLTLTVIRQVSSTGLVTVPSGVPTKSVTLKLTSSVMNLSLNGSTFTSHFYAAPTFYSVYATATANNASYAALTTVQISNSGGVSHPVVLGVNSTVVNFRFLQPSGTLLNASFPVTVVGPGGLSVNGSASVGIATFVLPSGATYSTTLDQTLLVTVNGVQEYQHFTVPGGQTCRTAGRSQTCSVTLSSTTLTSVLSGTSTIGGSASNLSGTVRIQGPGSTGTATTALLTSGAFSANLVPGTYSLFATAGSPGALWANVTSVNVRATTGGTVSLTLAPTWTETVTVLPPSGGIVGTATVTLTSAGGVNLTFPGQTAYSPATFVLPRGVYQIHANATTIPFGLPAAARGNATVSLLWGNAATAVSLQPIFRQTAVVSVLPPTLAILGTGGVATFTWTVRNTGNAPENLTLEGSPSFFGFSFSPSTVSLSVQGLANSSGGLVTVVVPSGTATTHPPVLFRAVLSNGTIAGTTSPGPTITLSAAPGVAVGPSAIAPSVGPRSATVSFFVANTGNTPEQLQVSVADAIRLAGLGWKTTLKNGKSPLTGPLSLDPGGNQTLTVELNATGRFPILPGYVVLLAQSTNATPMVTASTTISIPVLSLSTNPSTLMVTGPGIGSPSGTPGWLVPLLAFLPAIAFVVLVVTYRWSKTRRWVRR